MKCSSCHRPYPLISLAQMCCLMAKELVEDDEGMWLVEEDGTWNRALFTLQ